MIGYASVIGFTGLWSKKTMTPGATVARLISRSPLKAANQFEDESEAITISDDVLVESAKKGDADSFAKLMDRYCDFCLSKAYSILRNRGDAEDEVQDTWILAWTHLASYRVRGAFRGWLSRILFNQCMMRLRNKWSTRVVSIDQTWDPDGSYRLDLIDQRDLPEEVVGSYEVSRVLMKEIRGTPRVLREVLIMRYCSGLGPGEIAGQLGINKEAAKSRLMRARIELKRRLEKHHGERGFQTLTQKARQQLLGYSERSLAEAIGGESEEPADAYVVKTFARL
jgi:RNA polymerase sigma-70 factor, ECF subfamily